MANYAVAHLDEIEELDDGRVPMRPVRHHLDLIHMRNRVVGHETPFDGLVVIRWQ